MLQIQLTQPSPEQSTATTPTLADLSRNASVISTSSSSSSSSLVMPVRPRPIRTFSSPRSRSPHPPSTPRASRPPQYLSKELGIPDPDEDPRHSPSRGVGSRAQSRTRSRTNSVNGRFGADDFNFGDILGEGSYSTVRNMPRHNRVALLTAPCRSCRPPIGSQNTNTRLKSSTRATSPATTNSKRLLPRRIPSFDWDPVIPGS